MYRESSEVRKRKSRLQEYGEKLLVSAGQWERSSGVIISRLYMSFG